MLFSCCTSNPMNETQEINTENVFGLLREILRQSFHTGILQKLDEGGLTYVQRNCLIYITNKEKCGQWELAKEFKLNKSSITRIIDSFERKKLAYRVMDKEDRREKSLVPTELGKEIVKKIHKMPKGKITKMLASMDAADKQLLWKGLNLYHENLKKI